MVPMRDSRIVEALHELDWSAELQLRVMRHLRPKIRMARGGGQNQAGTHRRVAGLADAGAGTAAVRLQHSFQVVGNIVTIKLFIFQEVLVMILP